MSFLEKFFSPKKKKKIETPVSDAENTGSIGTGEDINKSPDNLKQDVDFQHIINDEPVSQLEKITPLKKNIGFKPDKTSSSSKSKSLKSIFVITVLAVTLGGGYIFFGDSIQSFFYPPVKTHRPMQPTVGSIDNSKLPAADIKGITEQITPEEIIADFSSVKAGELPESLTKNQETPLPSSVVDKNDIAAPIVALSPAVAIPSSDKPNVDNKLSDGKKVPAKTPSKAAATTPKKTTSKTPAKADKGKAKPAKKTPAKSVPKKTDKGVADQKTLAVPERFANKSDDDLMFTKENAPFLINNLLLQANSDIAKGNNLAALEKFEKAYKYSKNPDIEYNIILLSIETGNPNKAHDMLAKSWLPDTEIYELIQEMISAGYDSQAEKTIKEVLPRDTSGQLYYLQGYINEKNSDYSDASSNYRRAMIKSNYDPYITFAYARMQDILMNYAEAMTHYRIAANSQDMELRRAASKRVDELFNKK